MLSFTQKVYDGKRVKTTITLLPYGNGYRVKHVVTLKDPANSRCIGSSDVSYTDENDALDAFNTMCSCCEFETAVKN